MRVEKARNGDVEIAFERFGPSGGRLLVLIPGAGWQMVMWPVGFCEALVERGFHVVRIDNRDTGLSTHLTRYDVPRRRRPPRYALRDLTDDVLAVFDALDTSTGHLCGQSLGGMIAQATATYHPDRVASLTSMSSTPTLSPAAMLGFMNLRTSLTSSRILRKNSFDREVEGQKWVELLRATAPHGYPIDEDHWREAGRLSYDHGLDQPGANRLNRAVMAAGDRRRELADLRCPTLVIHGDADPVFPPRAGKATAEAIPGARLVTYPAMGHDVPRELWSAIADEINTLADRAGADTT